MFLAFMAVVAVGGAALVIARRRALLADAPMGGIWTREAFVVISTLLLLLLAVVTTAGTVIVPVSRLVVGRQVVVGSVFYNNVLIPVGLLLLTTMSLAPILQWGRPPSGAQRKAILLCSIAGVGAAVIGVAGGLRNLIAVCVVGLATVAAAAFVAMLIIDAQRRRKAGSRTILASLRANRRQYAGFMIHMGFVCLAIGVTGSSLGTRKIEVMLNEGEAIDWAGRRIRYEQLVQSEQPGKLVAEAVLHVASATGGPFTLRPARHLHLLQNEWTTEVAIHSTWFGDFYAVLNSGEGEGRVGLTLLANPLMRFIWLGGGIMAGGAIVALWPVSVQRSTRTGHSTRQSNRSRSMQLVPSR
jgi:cytochrome c-type biogenesis protein CcmF